MVKLSEGKASKLYLEKEFGKESLPLSLEMQDKLKKALEIASENIKFNNTVYTQSNSRVKETIVCEEKRLKKK